MAGKSNINANGFQVEVQYGGISGDFISLTDIARYKTPENPGYVIQNWMRTRNTVRFLGLWEHLHNSEFNYLEFEAIEKEAGLNSFVLTPKRWVDQTNAKGIITKQGRYASTFAHNDIAFEFASWISPEFKLYIVKDYQRLKTDENSRLSLNWNLSRELTKINYRIHTDAIKVHLIPEDISLRAQSFIYANEADVLNVALFGKTARMWRDENPNAKGNIRDGATLSQLIVLVNLESMNAELIKLGLSQPARATRLNKMAIEQINVLEETNLHKLLSE
ncbi:MAG: KilA-N domain-containing protein [Bacteroidales bacterium]|nr:KilA-N domain-containing protein [Bacteroidales bacterium]